MKNVLITIIVSFFAVVQNLNAAIAQKSPAVNMVSYEQSWLDSEGTIALKNNTSETIHNIKFVLEYLDMQGKPMDYETFSYNIDIAPGMTKKLDIPAYEHSRNYHYYKTKDGYGNPAFKLRYELKGFNLPDAKISDDDNNHSTSKKGFATGEIVILLTVFGVLGIFIGMYVLVAVMAKKLNRNPVLWLLLSFIATPFLICIILLAIGREDRNEY